MFFFQNNGLVSTIFFFLNSQKGPPPFSLSILDLKV